MEEMRRQGRVGRYVDESDIFWRISFWPAWARGILMQAHSSNRDRFALFFFLVANGMDPLVAGSWVLMTDAVGGIIKSWGYDNQAKRQIAQMVRETRNGTIFKGTKRYYNMVTGKAEKA